MTPVAQKRYRTEDGERRPKKKVRKYTKQADYHSSGDESDHAQNVASDAPRGMSKSVKKVEMTKGNAEPLGKRASKLGATTSKPAAQAQLATKSPARDSTKPKSILKQKFARPPTPESDPEEEQETEESGRGDGVQIDELEKNTALNMQADSSSADDDLNENDEPDLDAESSAEDEEGEDDDDGDDTSTTSSNAQRLKKKRNDPTAFATSISKILDTKLSTAKRSDPVLSRSRSAAEANKTLADSKLEQKARAQIRAEKREKAEKGHVKDVLGLETEGVDTGAVMEEEKRLKKTAQRGVVRLFNAVRAVQVKAEEAVRGAKEQGVVGIQKREERVNEMSKQGFLDLISSGGKQTALAEA